MRVSLEKGKSIVYQLSVDRFQAATEKFRQDLTMTVQDFMSRPAFDKEEVLQNVVVLLCGSYSMMYDVKDIVHKAVVSHSNPAFEHCITDQVCDAIYKVTSFFAEIVPNKGLQHTNLGWCLLSVLQGQSRGFQAYPCTECWT